MFKTFLRRIHFICITIAIGILSNVIQVDVSSKYVGLKRNVWLVDPYSAYLFQPDFQRKPFWYKTRTPIYIGSFRPNNLRHFQGLPSYRRTPHDKILLFGNTPRATLTLPNDVSLVKADVVSPYPTASTSTMSSTKLDEPYMRNSNSNKYYLSTSLESFTNCKSTNNNYDSIFNNVTYCSSASSTYSTPYANNYYAESKQLERVTSASQLATTAEVPSSKLLTHTYFTLDDVMPPHPHTTNFKYNSKRDNQPYANFVTQQSVPTVAKLSLAFGTPESSRPVSITDSTELHTTGTEPIRKLNAISLPPTAASPLQESTTVAIYSQPTATYFTIAAKQMSGNLTTTPKYELPSTTLATNGSAQIEVSKNKTKLFDKINFKHYIAQKTAEKLSKLSLQDLYNVSQSSSNEQHIGNRISTTSKYSFARKDKITEATVTLPSENPARPMSNVTTKLPIVKHKRKTANVFLVRRRQVNATDTIRYKTESNRNATTRNVTKQSLELSSTSVKKNEKNVVKPTQQTSLGNTSRSAKLRKFGNMHIKDANSKVNASLAESAIMTISINNEKHMQRTPKKYQQHPSKNNNFVLHNLSNTDVPPLPIEVYFRKINHKSTSA